jgi:hypothetical protein
MWRGCFRFFLPFLTHFVFFFSQPPKNPSLSYFMRPACPRSCLVRSACWPGGSHALPPWPGSATEAGTRRYFSTHPGASGAAGHARRDPALLGEWRAPGQTVRSSPWAWVGPVGLSTATAAPPVDDPASDEGVVAAVLAGLVGSGAGTNFLLVDPAAAGGRRLQAVGDALASLRLEADARVRSPASMGRAAVERSALILASKAGRLPDPAEGRKAAVWGRLPPAELAGPGGRACLHPTECLEPVFNDTLAALNVETLDLLLFDGVFEDHGPDAAAVEARLARAFAWAEAQRGAGRLGAYGLAEGPGGALTRPPTPQSDGNGGPPLPHASLARLVRLATSAAGGPGHGFRYVLVPAPSDVAAPADAAAAWARPAQALDPAVLAGGALAAPVPAVGGWGAAVAAAGTTAATTQHHHRLVPLTAAAAAMGVGVLIDAAWPPPAAGGDAPPPSPALEAALPPGSVPGGTVGARLAALAAGAPGVSAVLVSAARGREAVAEDLDVVGAGLRGEAWAAASARLTGGSAAAAQA